MRRLALSRAAALPATCQERIALGGCFAAMAVAITIAGLHAAVDFGGQALTGPVRDLSTVATVILVSLTVTWRALRVPEQRLAWRVLAAAVVCYSSGSLLWFSWLEHLSNPPIPSPSDALWLLFYPVSMVGIVLLLRAERPTASAIVWIQAALLGAGVGAAGVVLVFVPILLSASGSAPAVSTELAYPLGDLFLAGLVMAAWPLRGWRIDLPSGLLGAGFLLLALTDSLYGLAVARGSPIAGETVSVLYLVAFVTFALAAWAPPNAAPAGSASVRDAAQIEAELEQLRERAYRDRLTGLPNGLALEDELRAHESTRPFSVLTLDFDGMRDANNLFKSYRRGGDVLIAAVGRALARLVTEAEFAARQHTAGDEFAVLIPGADAEMASRRAGEIEASLDMLDVPPAYQQVYRGASVGHATRRPGETPGQVLGRAITAMQERKSARRAQHVDGRRGDWTDGSLPAARPER